MSQGRTDMARWPRCAGALLVALYLSRFPIVRHGGLWMFASVAVFGLSTLTFGLSHWVWLSALAIAGFAFAAAPQAAPPKRQPAHHL